MTRNYDAFTLAEVLITLVIIGIIASMTIPTLINKTQNQEFVSRLKKTYSTFANATNKIIFEEGTPKEWATTNESLYNTYKKHLQISKDCGAGSSCFPKNKYKRLNGTFHSGFKNRDELYSLQLADGISLLFGWTDNGLCAQGNNGNGTDNYCALIHVDVNGEKAPNCYGKDFFLFSLKEDGLYPAGCDDDVYCGNNTSGYGCACKVLREGAINY